jgi:hypothetical protein
MKNVIKRALISLMEAIVVFAIVFFVMELNGQGARIFVEFDVEDHLEGVESDFAVAMEFIDAIDFEALEKLELPDTTCIDPEILKDFIPPPLLGNRAYISTFDKDEREASGPTVYHSFLKGEQADCYAFVCYVREAENQNIWDDIRIRIRDTGVHGTQYEAYDVDDEEVEVDTIKGYKALVRRALDGGVGGQGALGISIKVGPLELDWNEILKAAKEGVCKGVQQWSCSAKFTDGSINGSVLVIPPGSLEGPCFSDVIMGEVVAEGASTQIAVAFAGAVWQGWKHWMSTFSGTFSNAFPSFVSFPGPSAPPTPVIPLPVISAEADREKLTAEELESQILALFGEWKDDPEAKKAVEEFAQWFDVSFTKAVAKGRIENLMGRGPVPTFNPPEVPNGPVEGGEVIQSPVTFSDFEFGEE